MSSFPPYDPGPKANLTGELMRLSGEWEKLGIDADDFLKCATCHKFIGDLVEGTEPKLEAHHLCNCKENDAS